MRNRVQVVGRAVGVAAMVGCAASEPALEGRDEAIVYGEDDRLDVYEHPDPTLRALARSTAVALIPDRRVTRNANGETRLLSTTLGQAYQLCSDQRFRNQLVASDCSGVLIDRDLVLTAGHCFEEQRACKCPKGDDECEEYAFVFDYFYRADQQLEPISAADMYSCRQLVVKELRMVRDGARVDYAIVQLDRPVLDRTPASVRTSALVDGEPLVVIGTGSGLPFKLDSGASVLEGRTESADYFTLEADTFEGSSGSGVFDASGVLAGLLVRGGTDYEQEQDEGCRRVRIRERATPGELGMGELGQEQATYVQQAIAGLCDSGFPSAGLCGGESRCGDSFCTGDETRVSCAQDCDPCEDGTCGQLQESASESGAAAKQSRRWQTGASCSLGVTRASPAGWSAPFALGLLLWRRRRVRSA